MRAPATVSHLRARALIALAAMLTLVGMIVGAGAATAAGTTTPAYPPSTCANPAVSTTTPTAGGTLTVTGTGYVAGASVSIVLTQGSQTWALASVVASSTGTFSQSVTLPSGVSGQASVTTTGGVPAGCSAVSPITITISAAQGASGGGGTPASTGVDVQVLLIVAGILLAVGLPLAVTRRRRGLGSNGRPSHRGA